MKPHKQRARQTAEEVAALGNPNQGGLTVDRQGARRPYTHVGKSWDPILTTRQREGLGRRVKLSRKLGRLWDMARGDGTEMTMAEFVRQLSPEELVRGQIKDKDGYFRGRPPSWVPREFHRACIDELMRRGKELWQENYLVAIETMTKIASGEIPAKPRDRLMAAKEVVERLEGKTPEKIFVQTDAPWMVLMDGIVAEVSEDQIARGQRALAEAQEAKNTIIIEGDFTDEEEEVPSPPPRRRAAPRRRR